MTTRTVLVGLGWSGREIWLPRLLGRDDYDVVAGVDPDPACRAAFTAATGRPAFADPGALDTGQADLAVVAVPNHAHAPVARTLLLRGLATFVEKPVCLTTDEAGLLADAEQMGGVPLLAGSAFRYRSDVTELARLVPALGRVRNVGLSWIRARGVPQAKGWFTHRALAGGGVLFDLGWHLLDVLDALVGPVTFEQIAAVTTDDHVNEADRAAAWRHDRPAPEGTADVEDTVRAFMVAGGGLSVGLRASWATHTATHDVTTVRVEGTAGTATLRCTFGFSPHREPRSRITHVRAGRVSDIQVPAEPVGAEYDRQLSALRTLLAAPSSRGRAIAGAHRIVAAVEAIYAAANTSLVPAGPAEIKAGER
ncbi:Gfo/Idh/MocA family protein [Streptomyces sp. NK08204]|uniref:Gfo/Idh/MocA family protein n=1 Tax=Streptomyces sp. NK08204 TaxID=2873260 RepID=UPI001CEC6733|nr:Gfo/Idh/MocA family oxidoreductase [Streptomyces sp. NK08204]